MYGEHSEMSVIKQVSAVEGCPLSGVLCCILCMQDSFGGILSLWYNYDSCMQFSRFLNEVKLFYRVPKASEAKLILCRNWLNSVWQIYIQSSNGKNPWWELQNYTLSILPLRIFYAKIFIWLIAAMQIANNVCVDKFFMWLALTTKLFSNENFPI